MKAYKLFFSSYDGFPLEAICKTPEECTKEVDDVGAHCWGTKPEEIEVPDNYFEEAK